VRQKEQKCPTSVASPKLLTGVVAEGVIGKKVSVLGLAVSKAKSSVAK
jgi:hypothetical protein